MVPATRSERARPDQTERGGSTWWIPAITFIGTVVAFMPLALIGLRTYLAVDLNQVGFPYDAISPDRITRPTLQTDQVEWLPWLVDFWAEARTGNFPLWSHDIAGGSPHGVLPFLGTLSPFNYGLAVLPAWYGISLGVALSLIAAQWGTYLLCRRLGTGVIPATIAGVGYGFTGTYLVMIHRITAIALVPLVLWAVHRLVDEPRRRNVALVAGLVGWTWFAGFPSGFVYTVYIVAIWGLWLLAQGVLERRLSGRDAGRRLIALGVAGGLGSALAMITLLPFANEVLVRESLSERVWGSSDHMPTLNLFGVLDQVAIGDAVNGPWFAGWNPIETSTQVGFIVMGLACLGLALAAADRLTLPSGVGPIWTFWCLMAAVTTTLVWLGTPLLGLVYKLPGIGSGPIPRLRFFLPLALVALVAFTIDALWSKRVDGQPAPRLISAATLVFFVLVFAWHTPAYWDLMSANGQRRNVGVGFLIGLGLFGVVTAAVLWASGRPRLHPIVGLAVAALVFGQAWYPFRNITPQADPDWFYTSTTAHDTVHDLTDGRFRFLAPGVQNFYPNGSQVTEIIDLRGVTIYDPEFKKLVEVASPEAYTRDPFKITSIANEWDWASPALDALAIGVIALPLDEPIGTTTPATPFDGFMPTDVLAASALESTAPGPITGLSLPINRSGTCTDERWELILRNSDGRELDRTGGWAVDLPFGDDGLLTAALVGTSLDFRDRFAIDLDLPFTETCEVSAGIRNAADPRVALTPWFTTPEFPEPLAIATTDEAAIYTRPSANELVSSHGTWTIGAVSFGRLDTGLPTVTQGGSADEPPLPPAADGAAATIHGYAFIDDGVDIDLTASTRALVLIAQDDAYGWEATVDGRPVDIQTVHGSLTGVVVEAGAERIELRYRPQTFALGWKISTIAFFVIAGLFVSDRGRGQSEPAAVESVDGRELGDEFGERLTEVTQERPEPSGENRVVREH